MNLLHVTIACDQPGCHAEVQTRLRMQVSFERITDGVGNKHAIPIVTLSSWREVANHGWRIDPNSKSYCPDHVLGNNGSKSEEDKE